MISITFLLLPTLTLLIYHRINVYVCRCADDKGPEARSSQYSVCKELYETSTVYLGASVGPAQSANHWISREREPLPSSCSGTFTAYVQHREKSGVIKKYGLVCAHVADPSVKFENHMVGKITVVSPSLTDHNHTTAEMRARGIQTTNLSPHNLGTVYWTATRIHNKFTPNEPDWALIELDESINPVNQVRK